MAKETVGARVPVAIAEQVAEYAETHGITRTEAIGLFIRTGYDEPEGYRRKRSYTVRIREVERARDRPLYAGGWRGELRKADRMQGDWENTEALTARLPGDVVQRVEDWRESQDMAKTVAAADLIQRGLRADPLPESNPDPIPDRWDAVDGDDEPTVETIELEPETLDLFRRCRLYYRSGPSRTVNKLIGATYSTANVRLGWEKPETGTDG